MKRISGLSAPPPGLARFQHDPDFSSDWETFGAFERGQAKKELAKELSHLQHGLCAYCEINLIEDDTQIEHVVPRSDPTDGRRLSTDHRNMFGCCKGGNNRNFASDTLTPDERRYLQPVKMNLSCGAAKGDLPRPEFIDPRQLPASPPMILITSEGAVHIEPGASAQLGHKPADVEKHVRLLGLDVTRLRLARAAIYESLQQAVNEFVALPVDERDRAITALAESQLLPDAVGALAPFFTTARSFFDALAERILQRPPQAWV